MINTHVQQIMNNTNNETKHNTNDNAYTSVCTAYCRYALRPLAKDKSFECSAIWLKQYASQHKDRSPRCLRIHNRPKVSRQLGTCNQPSRPCKGRGSVAARWGALRADRCAGRDKTRGWCPRGIPIRREATKEFLPGLIGTHRLTHDMSPTDMMQPRVHYTCIRSSALLEALRRQMDPSSRQLEADT